MSRAQFDALRTELEGQRWNRLDIHAENALGAHVKRALEHAAWWAKRFDVSAGWFKADYAAIACPGLAPPEAEIAATLAACRANGERSRYGRVYMDLLLRWAWIEGEVDMDGLPAPYAPLLAVLYAGAGIGGEHGFLGPGAVGIRIGRPEEHLQDA